MKIFTLQFAAAEFRRIEKAAKLCGSKAGGSADFARRTLLACVDSILASRPRRQPPKKASRRN
jgi:hypothetical protein